MAQLKINVPEDFKENIERVCEHLGAKVSDFVREALFEFLVLHGHRVDQDTRIKMAARKERRKQNQLFFVKNEFQRLYKQVEWQYRLFAEVKFDSVSAAIARAEDRFALLDEDVKKDLSFQFKEFKELGNEKVFAEKFDYLVPKLQRVEWKKTKQLR